MKLNDLTRISHNTAKEHGFWTANRNFGEIIALIHSEVTEALEEYRDGFAIDFEYEVDGKPCGVPSELADIIIRVLDVCGFYNIDIEDHIIRKLNYNSNRPYKHGREF